jgi:hypothetical protein
MIRRTPLGFSIVSAKLKQRQHFKCKTAVFCCSLLQLVWNSWPVELVVIQYAK